MYREVISSEFSVWKKFIQNIKETKTKFKTKTFRRDIKHKHYRNVSKIKDTLVLTSTAYRLSHFMVYFLFCDFR